MAICLGRDAATRTWIYQLSEEEMEAVQSWATAMVPFIGYQTSHPDDSLSMLLEWLKWGSWAALARILRNAQERTND